MVDIDFNIMHHLKININDFTFNKTDKDLFINSGCLRIKRKKEYYLVTLHQFLPIRNNIYLNEEKLRIGINCKWNELLILKEEDPKKNIDLYPEIKTFDKIAKKVPNIGSVVRAKDKNLLVSEYRFIPLGHIPGNPLSIYMNLKTDEPEYFEIGTPVYTDKLEGIVAIVGNGNVFCIPAYCISKTFDRENNLKLDLTDNIFRINKHLVKDSNVFNPYLGMFVPISTFLLLEQDRKLSLYDENGKLIPNGEIFRDKSDKLVQNKRNLLFDEKDYYQISLCSINLLKNTYPDLVSKFMKRLFDPKDNFHKFKIHKGYIVTR